MSIEVNGIIKTYGSQKAVNAISFSAQKGGVIGFLGPNGAGKSTTMKMITGYLLPDTGTIQVCGIDVQKDPVAAKRKIGYLPEANPLYYVLPGNYVKVEIDIIDFKIFRLKCTYTFEIVGTVKKEIGFTYD